MAGFNLDDYEPVDARIKKAMADISGYRMTTDLVHMLDGMQTVIFRADLWDGGELLATGWATETAGEGYVNKTSHLENCETSAIGRALANYGYSGDKRPSREEMDKSPEPAKTPKQQEHEKRQIIIGEIAAVMKDTNDGHPLFTEEEKDTVKAAILKADTLKALSDIQSVWTIRRDQRTGKRIEPAEKQGELGVF